MDLELVASSPRKVLMHELAFRTFYIFSSAEARTSPTSSGSI
jgi:hypothetical protein